MSMSIEELINKYHLKFNLPQEVLDLRFEGEFLNIEDAGDAFCYIFYKKNGQVELNPYGDDILVNHYYLSPEGKQMHDAYNIKGELIK